MGVMSGLPNKTVLFLSLFSVHVGFYGMVHQKDMTNLPPTPRLRLSAYCTVLYCTSSGSATVAREMRGGVGCDNRVNPDRRNLFRYDERRMRDGYGRESGLWRWSTA